MVTDLVGEDAFACWELFTHLVLGWPMYIIFNTTGARRTPEGDKITTVSLKKTKLRATAFSSSALRSSARYVSLLSFFSFHSLSPSLVSFLRTCVCVLLRSGLSSRPQVHDHFRPSSKLFPAHRKWDFRVFLSTVGCLATLAGLYMLGDAYGHKKIGMLYWPSYVGDAPKYPKLTPPPLPHAPFNRTLLLCLTPPGLTL